MDNRARIGYVDFVMVFATLVAVGTVAPWMLTAIDMLRNQVDPLTSVLLGLVLPMILIGMIYSLGVSARS
jgi:hypothetical protein